MRASAPVPVQFTSPRWERADTHLLVAIALVLLFTAQRLTGYMTLWLYKRLPYEYLVLAAHVVGGAALVVAGTLGARPVRMQTRTIPLLRVLANHGWSLGGFLVLLLWWMCWPGLRPDENAGRLAGAAVFIAVVLVALRPFESWVAAQRAAHAWRAVWLVGLWQAYSLHWELVLNFRKDELTALRAHVQWEQVAADVAGTLLGLAWVAWAARPRPERE